MNTYTKYFLYLLLAILITYFGFRSLDPIDFPSFYDVAGFAWEKEDIYAPSPRTEMYVFYLPFFSLLIMPFYLFPIGVAAFIWYGLKIICYWKMIKHSLVLPAREACDKISLNAFYYVLPILIMLNPVTVDLMLGQVNAFVLFFIVAALYSLEKQKEWKAAIFFSFSCVKIVPLVFLPYFLIRKKWTFLVKLSSVFAMLGLFYFGWFGFAKGWLYINNWFEISHLKINMEQNAFVDNQSLLGLIARSVLHTHIMGENQLLYTMRLFTTSSILLTSLTLYAIWRIPKEKIQMELEISIMLVLMLLVSPDTRIAHLVHFLIPVMFFTKEIFLERKRGETIVAMLLIILILIGQDLTGRVFMDWARSLSVHTFLMLLLLFWMLRIARRDQSYLNRAARTATKK